MKIYGSYITFTLLVGVTVIILAIFIMTALGSVKDDLKKADAYYTEGSYRLALEEYQKVYPNIKDSDKKIDVSLRMIDCHFRLRNYSEAIKSIDDLRRMKIDRLPKARLLLFEAKILNAQSYYSNYDKILSLLNDAEKLFREESLVVTRSDLIELYKLRINLYAVRYWSDKEWLNKAEADTEKLIGILANDQERAEALYNLAGLTLKTYDDPKMKKGINVLNRIIEEYPDTRSAIRALYLLGSVYERNEDYLLALKYYNATFEKSPLSSEGKNAKESIKRITSPYIHVIVPQVYKPGDQIKVNLTSRNVGSVKFEVYRVGLEKIFKKIGNVDYIEFYNISGDDPMEFETVKMTGDKKDHKYIKSDLILDLKDNGSYIIKASSDNIATQSVLLVSDLTVLFKRGSNKTVIWAVDSISGKPENNVNLLIASDRKEKKHKIKDGATLTSFYFGNISSGKTNDAGIYQIKSGSKDRYEIFCIAKKGNRYAVLRSWHSYGYYGYGKQFKAYIETDRPVYRPGHTVNFKATLREYEGEKYLNKPNEKAIIMVFDSKGNKIKEIELKSNDFGSISGSFDLLEKDPLGQYSIQVVWNGSHYHYFRVEEYKKPEFLVSVTPAEKQYRLNEDVKVRINAMYYFGEPAIGAEVTYSIQKRYYYSWYSFPREYGWYYDSTSYDYLDADDYRRESPSYYGNVKVKDGKGVTDSEGNLIISFKTEPDKNDKRTEKFYSYVINVEVVDKSRRMIKGQGSVVVGEKAFMAYLQPQRYLYSKDDKVEIKIITRTLTGDQISTKGKLILEEAKYNDKKRDYLFNKINSWDFATDESNSKLFSFKAEKEGYFRVAYKSVDKYDKPVAGYCWVWIASKDFRGAFYKYQGLEIVTDKDCYSDGETAQLLINTDKFTDSYVLLTLENDSLHTEKVIKLKGNSSMVDLEIKEGYGPNAWITANLISDFKYYSAQKEIIIPPKKNFLNIKVDAGKTIFKPGEKAVFTVTATDVNGKPVSGEVSLGVIDASIFYISPDRTPDVRQYFYGNRRYLSISTSSSFDFRFYSRDLRENEELNGVGGAAEGRDYLSESVAVKAQAPAETASRAKMSMQKKNGDKELVEAEVRSDFRDTAYWTPSVVTGTDGKAKVEFTMPDALTTWRLTARAITKDTRVGNIQDDLITKKNLLVRLQTPRFFTERDEVTVSTVIHNYLPDKVKARVYLKATGLELIDKEPQWVEIEKNGDERIDFSVRAEQPGTAKITAYGLTTEESDAMELQIPVLVHGLEKRQAFSGRITDMKEIEFDLPKDRRKGKSELLIKLTPSIAGVILDSLDYLVQYPYGCVEQTMSRFLPAVIAAKTLKDLGGKNEKLENKIPDVIMKGLDRLFDFQHSDGGWGWWKDDSSTLYMTSYVYQGLCLADQAGYGIVPSRLADARKFIESKILNNNTRLEELAFALFALSHCDKISPEVKKKIEYLYEKRRDMNGYGKALLALVLARNGYNDKAAVAMRNLYDFARIDEANSTMSWSEESGKWWYWYNDSVEMTSAGLRAYMFIEPESKYIPLIVRWLVENRKGNRWKSTKDTALAVLALTEYLKKSMEMQPDYNVTVKLGETELTKIHLTKKDLFDYGKELMLKEGNIPEGKFKIKISRSGRGELYYSAVLKYFTKEEDIKGSGHGINIERKYFRVDDASKNKSERTEIKYLSQVRSGDKIDVELYITSSNDYEYLVLEDYKISGIEPLALVSGYDWKSGIASHREMRDDRVVYFINWLPQGKHILNYRVRAEIPGKFHTMPAVMYAMYAPDIYATSDEFRVEINEKGQTARE